MRLQELHINNFKFFPKQDPKSHLLRIDGKNLLIYGENGSGKSTIYWAIYTLLESAFKQGQEGKDKITKYFIKNGEFGLVNINAPKRHNAYIKAVLKDHLGNRVEYFINGEEAVINTAQRNSAIRESNMASDFINYRAIFRLHHIKHSKENNLFSWFEDEIFQYILIRSISTTQNVGDNYKILKSGPKKVNAFDEINKMIFPNPSMLEHAQEAVRKDHIIYKRYVKSVDKWNKKIGAFLKDISIRANEILKNDFKQNFEFKFGFKGAAHNVTPEEINWKDPEITLSVPKYEGKRNVVKRAHSFLNEAKWSAIGLAIRFAIIEDWTNRPNTAELKALIIDDMLLSLDMSNRNIVLDLLLNRYAIDYQLIIMSHDRYFYELAKGKINSTGKSNEWKCLEMYQEEKSRKKYPIILNSKTNLEKAKIFFMQKEFAASANHMRKATECFVYSFVPKNKQYDKSFNQLDLSKLINRSRALGRVNHWPSNLISDLDIMRTNIFNPGSHCDVYTPVFQNELEKAITALERISVLSNIKL